MTQDTVPSQQPHPRKQAARVGLATLCLAVAVSAASRPSDGPAPTNEEPLTPSRHVMDIVEIPDTEQGRATLREWVADTQLDTTDRYVSLRQLEALDAPSAIQAATELLTDTDRQLRLNAIAVLARSSDPAAKSALATLSPSEQVIAGAVAAAMEN